MTRFEAKMASSHDGTYPRDVLQGLITGTSRRDANAASPLVCADLNDSKRVVQGYSSNMRDQLVLFSVKRRATRVEIEDIT